jgi:hypothetical protein
MNVILELSNPQPSGRADECPICGHQPAKRGGWGAKQNFELGGSLYMWRTAVGVLLPNAKVHEVYGQTWKTMFGLIKQPKSVSLAVARKLFPTLHQRLKFKKDHNRAEALLIAEYGRRMLVGEQG